MSRGRILTRRLAIAGSCALAVAPPALAHRSQSVLTTINWNATTSRLEVMHRIHAHDAEVGLMQATGSNENVDITVLRNQAQLMLYVEKHFSLMAPQGAITLQPLGAEFKSEAIVLYQEAKLAAPPVELTIENQILRDVFDQQTNLVNLKLDKRTRWVLSFRLGNLRTAAGRAKRIATYVQMLRRGETILPSKSPARRERRGGQRIKGTKSA